MDMTIRPRRLRTSAKLRKMVRETRMDKSSLVYPMFVMDGENKKEEITVFSVATNIYQNFFLPTFLPDGFIYFCAVSRCQYHKSILRNAVRHICLLTVGELSFFPRFLHRFGSFRCKNSQRRRKSQQRFHSPGSDSAGSIHHNLFI